MTDKNYTHVCFVVDRSGSMSNIARDMDGGIKQLLNEQAKLPGYVVVDIITFDDRVEHLYRGVRPDDVKGDLIVPRGSTALNDALATSIIALGERFAAMDESERPENVIVVVVTDGGENASKEYGGGDGTARVKELVRLQQEKYNWEFLFLATGIDAFGAASGYGIDKGNTISFDATEQGTHSVTRSASAYMSAYRSGNRDVQFTEEDRQAAESA